MLNFKIIDFEFLQNLIKNYDNLEIIINKIREKIKINQINLNLKKELKKFKKIFDNILLISNKNLKLELEIDKLLPETVCIEISNLFHILFNVISNSIKFSSNGKITLKVT